MKKNISKLQPCVSHNYNSPWAGDAWGNTGVDTTFKPLTVTTDENGSGTTGKSGKWTDENTNTAIQAGSNLLGKFLDIFKKPDNNTTYVVGGGGNDGGKDNTMLYVGIGGVILVVVLFAIIAFKK